MKNLRYLMAFLILFLMAGCEDFFETNLELEAPDFNSQLVIGALFKTGNADHDVYFSKTVAIDQDTRAIDMSSAELWIENSKGDRFNFRSKETKPKGYFTIGNDLELKVGESYNIFGYHPGYDTAFASTSIPGGVALQSWEYHYHSGTSQWGEERSGVTVTFKDPPGEDNYYRASIYIREKSGSYYNTYTSSVDPAVSESGEFNYVVLEDSSFDGEEKTITFQFYKFWKERIVYIDFEWSSITEEQYHFDKTLNQFEDNRYNPFAAPTEIEGNVENGLGFFGIENRQTYKIEL